MAVMHRPPPPSTTIWRGLRKRCGRCGYKPIFRRWLEMKERCPGCGYRFEREEGFFTGVYFVNLAITEIVLFVVLMIVIVVLSNDTHFSLAPFIIGGVAIAVILPFVAYPYAKATWSAIDLALRPLEPVEEAEALLAHEADDDEDEEAKPSE